MLNKIFFLFIFPFLLTACGDGNNGSTVDPITPPADLPKVSIESASTSEGDEGETTLTFNLTINGTYTEAIKVDYMTGDKSALAGIDYMPVSETLTINSPATSATIDIVVLADKLKEGIEEFVVQLTNPVNATISENTGVGRIQNDDSTNPDVGEDGYTSPDNYNLWKIKWAEEFNEAAINTENWTFEIGNGCNQGICGWGNNELESYTDQEENARIENGHLIIEAKPEGETGYSSARMITKDKEEFRFGRIDIRAKLPKGQGIWPAIWMLGANIDDVGWPACGEIDIMELVGHQPTSVHGTVHYGPPAPQNQYKGSSINTTSGDFSDRFHVFSLVWQAGSMYWYVDDVVYFDVSPDKLGNYTYPFNQNFFFILNVAVGGNWPGSPDETTVFPQRMEVDYIRVFERE